CSAARSTFRRRDLVPDERLPDVQPPFEELDVLPAQAEQLSTTKAGGECNRRHTTCGGVPGLLSVFGVSLQRPYALSAEATSAAVSVSVSVSGSVGGSTT